jgi:hypothetical protein
MQVNCLIAFTNNPHSLDVALNAIAFLRFCAMKLAEGDIGEHDTSFGTAGQPTGRPSCMPCALVLRSRVSHYGPGLMVSFLGHLCSSS